MDFQAALDWEPPLHWARLQVIDAHTGGEPFRVVVEGLPNIPGETVLARRRYAEQHLDHFRRLLMWEPRGHADMYGGWPGTPVRPDSDLSVLFLHNQGFSTMCGHGIIALTTVVFDTGMITVPDPPTLRIDTPAGQIVATAEIRDGRVASVSFVNVPSFVAELDCRVDVPELGEVEYDLAFGGAFYAYVESATLGVSLDDPSGLIDAGRKIKAAITASRTITHPVEPDLGFLYGVIFTGAPSDSANHSRNVCVFADGEVDRSPTGTGVSGRLAILHARNQVGADQPIKVESIVGSVFEGRVLATTRVGDIAAVVPEVTGSAHITGRSVFWVDPDDHTGTGFLVR